MGKREKDKRKEEERRLFPFAKTAPIFERLPQPQSPLPEPENALNAVGPCSERSNF